MSARRAPSDPPAIPGFQPGRLLGMGGFADVFLYQQAMPRRPVAVKVLLASLLSDEALERFRSEANLMATLSHHPSIVTVLQADVAADGRPYLVMEYCSRPGLGQRYRKERMSVPEVLRIGIRLAAAVETAHRAGILHRDIKPANVLVTDFGWPALTDFGIAATTSTVAGAVGMSIPWSPPEALAEHPTSDVRSDVYSLAATVYSLLVGRSPFEVVEGPNTAADLVARIERVPLAVTGRADVPWALQEAIARAMDRDPARRFHSAMAFGHALQHIEGQMSLSLTPLDLPDEVGPHSDAAGQGTWPGAAGDGRDAGQATRLRPVMTIAPDGPARPATRRDPAAVSTTAAPVAADLPQSPPSPEETEPVVGPSRAPLPRAAVALVGVVLLGALAWGAWGAFTSPVESSGPEPASGGGPIVRAVPTPTDLTGVITDGIATFTWTNPDPQAGDRYLWAPAEVGTAAAGEIVDVMTVSLPADDTVCIEVALVRSDRRYSNVPATGCAEP